MSKHRQQANDARLMAAAAASVTALSALRMRANWYEIRRRPVPDNIQSAIVFFERAVGLPR